MGREIQGVFCREIIRVDHTGKAARNIRSAGGKWVANVMNEDNMVASFFLVTSGAKAGGRDLTLQFRGAKRIQKNRSRSMYTSIKIAASATRSDSGQRTESRTAGSGLTSFTSRSGSRIHGAVGAGRSAFSTTPSVRTLSGAFTRRGKRTREGSRTRSLSRERVVVEGCGRAG